MEKTENNAVEECSFFMKPFRDIHENNLRKRLKHRQFTLISQNCMGGVIYNMLGLQSQSPTVNMFIRGESFVRLASNPRKYMQEMEPFPINEKHEEEGFWPHPVIGIGDIRLNCLHYDNCQEAIDSWKRRCERIDFSRILVMANDWDLNYDEALIKGILELPCPKVLFSTRVKDKDDIVYCTEKVWTKRGRSINMPVLTEYKYGYKRCFEYIFDVVDWINSSLG